ncbi:MAG: DUF4330 domain-containing protein [Cyanobacteriota bacterium]|nr:DUF4330 domain-containing protein [Cyanobacteriota bacterium]
MAILDSKGRLFGKLSLLDLGAALIILAVIFGIFIFPGSSGSVAQLGTQTKPIEMDLVVRGLSVLDPDTFLNELNETKETRIIIRNEPRGEIAIKKIEPLKRLVIVPQPDGSVKALPDPRPPEESFSTDFVMTLADEAEITDGEAVIAGEKVKIGTVLELDGQTYNFRGSIMDVRIGD